MNNIQELNFPKDMSEEKKQFLIEAIQGSCHLGKNELLPYLTKLIRSSKEKHLEFSDEEIRFIIIALRSGSTPEQRAYIDQFLSKAKDNKNNNSSDNS